MSQQNFVLILKGIAVGIANIIPGVSGGTIALITKIYNPLLGSLKKINVKSLKLLFKCEFKEFNKYTNFKFLLYCGIGILLGVIIYTAILTNLLGISAEDDSPKQLTGFFFGLILASIFYISKRIEKLFSTGGYMSLPIFFAAIVETLFVVTSPLSDIQNPAAIKATNTPPR